MKTPQGCLLGLDVGTTGSKAIAFTHTGEPVGRGYADYPLQVDTDGRAELDAGQVLAAVRQAVADAVSASAAAGPPLALAIAAQGEAVTPVDGRLEPVGPSLVTFDRRGQAGHAILARAGWEARTEAAGLPLSWIVTAAKLAYLRQVDAAAYADASAFLCYEDLVVGHLTGQPAISDSLAQRTWLLDRFRRDWDEAALADLGLRGRLPPVARPGTPVGRVGATAAAAFGLPEGTVVVAGAHDQTAALVGVGGLEPGLAAHSTGTVDCMSLCLAAAPAEPFCRRGYGLGLHPIQGLAVTLAFGFGGGSLLAWWQSVLGGAPDIGDLLADVPLEPGLPFAVPFWAGSGTPDFDAADQGAIFGLTLDSGRRDLTAALVRGMALEAVRNLAILAELGLEVRDLRLVGGGARSPRWSQVRADAAGRAYRDMPVRDAGCLGAAMMAGVGAGVFPDLPTAARNMVRTGTAYIPDPARHAGYRDLFPAYLAAVQGTRALRRP